MDDKVTYNKSIINFVNDYGIRAEFDGDDAFDMIRAWERSTFRRQAQEAPKAESQSAEDDFGPVNLNDEEPDKLKAARKARAWIDGILCQCDTTVDHVCDRCVLIRSIDKALSALDEGRKG